MANPYSLEEALQPSGPQGYSLEDALQPLASDKPLENYNGKTFLSDVGKGIAGAAIRGTTGMPQVIEDQARSMARNEIATNLARPKGLSDGALYDLVNTTTPQKALFTKALDAFKAGESIVGTSTISDLTAEMGKLFKSSEQQKIEKEAKQQADVILANTPKVKGIQQLYDWGKETGNKISESRSQNVKDAIANSQATGNIVKAI